MARSASPTDDADVPARGFVDFWLLSAPLDDILIEPTCSLEQACEGQRLPNSPDHAFSLKVVGRLFCQSSPSSADPHRFPFSSLTVLAAV